MIMRVCDTLSPLLEPKPLSYMPAWCQLSTLPLAQLDERLQSVQIAAPAQPGDLSDADGGDERFVAEGLACVDIRYMYLDDRAVGVLEGIAQAVTGMGQPAR